MPRFSFLVAATVKLRLMPMSNFNSSSESLNKDGFVKDEQVAIEIAVTEWTRYGPERNDRSGKTI